MNIVIVGHVDHGKSTLMGRLLADTGSLPDGKLEQVQETCRRNAKPFEYAFLLDALKDEQAQGITIDTARCFFKTDKRDYIILDAPGHIEFLKNMITGASRAEAAILMIDALEGVKENSRRHAYMLSMLGIKQIAVVINKMDLVDYSQEIYESIKSEYLDFLDSINIVPRTVLPVSAFEGENIVNKSDKMSWYDGMCVLEVLDDFESESEAEALPFRMPVQDVYRFTENGDDRRIIAGTIESGTIREGDRVVFYPSGKRSVISGIERFHAPHINEVSSGMAVGFTLSEQIYVTRGELMTIEGQKAPETGTRISANVFWLGEKPLVKGKTYLLKIGTQKLRMELEQVNRVINSSNLKTVDERTYVERHEVAECILKTKRPLAFDPVSVMAKTSRFVIVDEYEIAGGGIITELLTDKNIVWQQNKVTYEDRCNLLGQKGMVVWFTGLSGAGKSTIAVELEKLLYEEGRKVYLLDGDNIRHGINSDLGFTDEDRNENIRRIGEIAALFADAGIITLVSFISPFRTMRHMARKCVNNGSFIEVYVNTDLETCMKRDPKGLYKKNIKNFTGRDSVYEPPLHPEVVLDTIANDPVACAEQVMAVIRENEQKLKRRHR